MNVNEAISLANQLELLITNSLTYNMSREQLIQGIGFVSKELREYADKLDADMYNELGTAYEKYDDAMVVG